MKKIICICLFTLSTVIAFAEQPKLQHAPAALPGVEPEMLSADYWIALQPDADAVIMTPEEIMAFNEKNRARKVVFKDYYGKPDPLQRDWEITHAKGPVMNLLKPLEMPERVSGDSLRIMLTKNIEWLYASNFFDNRNAPYNDAMRDEVKEAMNLDSIPDVIVRRWGIVVERADIRHYPTAVPGYSDTQYELDLFQATALYTNNPVAVLHQSRDGAFLYVESTISRGWVDARCIAFAGRETIQSLTEDKNFLMATADKVPVYGDPGHNVFAGYLYFSSRLPLVKHDEKNYIVKLLNRLSDGSLAVTEAYIKPDADVHIGYLPYTKRNVLTQIFKLLGQPYGWADQDKKRDCSGTMRVLLNCFGIETGRHPSYILSSSDHQHFIDPTLTAERKKADIAKLDPVITMAGNSGHIVLYLGKGRNGKLYFIHQVGWGYDDQGIHYVVNRVAINCIDHDFYGVSGPNVFTTYKNPDVFSTIKK